MFSCHGAVVAHVSYGVPTDPCDNVTKNPETCYGWCLTPEVRVYRVSVTGDASLLVHYRRPFVILFESMAFIVVA